MYGSDSRQADYGEYFHWMNIKTAREKGMIAIENWGTTEKRLCLFKSKFNPLLEPRFFLKKDDLIGRLATWSYESFKNPPLIGKLIARDH